jgi:hypothetical protein
MKAVKTLLIFSAMATASAVNAATVATFDADITLTLSGITSGSGIATGTAVLDDSGVLTVNAMVDANPISAGATLGTITAFSGTYAAGSFTANSATISTTACIPEMSPACVTIGPLPTTPFPLDAVSGTVTSALGGAISLSQSLFGGSEIVSSIYTLTPSTPSPVPIPAAAWLFGSGLVGLSGIARRRLSTKKD